MGKKKDTEQQEAQAQAVVLVEMPAAIPPDLKRRLAAKVGAQLKSLGISLDGGAVYVEYPKDAVRVDAGQLTRLGYIPAEEGEEEGDAGVRAAV